MALKKSHIIIGAALLADLAMTAAVFIKTCLPTVEELTDKAVDDAWKELEHEFSAPIGFDDEPEEDEDDKGESCEDFDRMFDEVMSRPTPEHRERDLFNEGVDAIMRYEVNGKTGLEPEDETD